MGFLDRKPIDFRKQLSEMNLKDLAAVDTGTYHDMNQPFALISSQNQKRIETPPVTCLLRTRKHELVKQSCSRHREADGYKSAIV